MGWLAELFLTQLWGALLLGTCLPFVSFSLLLGSCLSSFGLSLTAIISTNTLFLVSALFPNRGHFLGAGEITRALPILLGSHPGNWSLH